VLEGRGFSMGPSRKESKKLETASRREKASPRGTVGRQAAGIPQVEASEPQIWRKVIGKKSNRRLLKNGEKESAQNRINPTI